MSSLCLCVIIYSHNGNIFNTLQYINKMEDIAKGIVKWLVDIYDETGETVALATILTMVKKLNQE